MKDSKTLIFCTLVAIACAYGVTWALDKPAQEQQDNRLITVEDIQIVVKASDGYYYIISADDLAMLSKRPRYKEIPGRTEPIKDWLPPKPQAGGNFRTYPIQCDKEG